MRERSSPCSFMSSMRAAGSRKPGRARIGLPKISRVLKPSGLPFR
jgi:hypothetical protein